MFGEVSKWPDLFFAISPMPQAVHFSVGTSFRYSEGTLIA